MDAQTKAKLAGMSASDVEHLIEAVVEAVARELGGPASAKASAGGPAPASCGCGASEKASAPSAPTAPAPAPAAPAVPGDRMSVPPGTSPSQCRRVADFIDHTILKPDATEAEVRQICREARDNSFASVCVNGSYVDLVAAELRGSSVKTCAVVGFPLGAMTSAAKGYEAGDLIRRGADEIDMVINVGMLKSRDYEGVLADILSVRQATRGHVLKVILETSMLDTEEKRAACVLSKAAGADFVKTSTGFGGGGATAEDIALMRQVVGPKMGVKASGGIRTCEGALAMIESGATRLGASAGVRIIAGEASTSKY